MAIAMVAPVTGSPINNAAMPILVAVQGLMRVVMLNAINYARTYSVAT